MNQANKITGYKQISLQVLFDCFMEKTAIGIFKDHIPSTLLLKCFH